MTHPLPPPLIRLRSQALSMVPDALRIASLEVDITAALDVHDRLSLASTRTHIARAVTDASERQPEADVHSRNAEVAVGEAQQTSTDAAPAPMSSRPNTSGSQVNRNGPEGKGGGSHSTSSSVGGSIFFTQRPRSRPSTAPRDEASGKSSSSKSSPPPVGVAYLWDSSTSAEAVTLYIVCWGAAAPTTTAPSGGSEGQPSAGETSQRRADVYTRTMAKAAVFDLRVAVKDGVRNNATVGSAALANRVGTLLGVSCAHPCVLTV